MNNRFSKIFFLASFIIVFFKPVWLKAQSQKQYNIIHLDADLKINPYRKEVTGKAEYKIVMLNDADSIFFDSQGITTLKVKSRSFKTSFQQTNKLLVINKKFKKNKTYRIRIWYRVKPKIAMYFTGWQTGGRKQVWTQGQGKDNSHWLPTDSNQNDKFTWKFHINFPKDYMVISNGEFLSHKLNGNGTATTVFEQSLPAPAYLIFIGAGKYAEQKVMTSSQIPVYNYQYTDRLNIDKTYYKTKEIFDAVEQEIGVPYPWKNYKQIPCRDFLYGGMENVSATSFNGDRYVTDSMDFVDTNFVNVSAHELTHQWFGDLVTGKKSADHWLHEAFATYYARLIDARIFGKDYADFNAYNYDRQIIAAQKIDTVPLHRPNASSLTYYRKGAKIIDMLRQEIGDENYRKLIKAYFKRFAFGNAGTQDFKNLLYEVTGDSLPKFFKLWFEDYHIPEFSLVQHNDSIIFKKNNYQLPVDFLIVTNEKQYILRASKSFKLHDYKSIKTVVVNPGNKKLYDITFERSPFWIKNQILGPTQFIDRYMALKRITQWRDSEKDSIYKQLIDMEQYYPVYAEIIKNIKDNLNETHLQMFKQLFQKDIKTRQQIAIELDNIPEELKDNYKTLLDDASYVTKQAALWHYWMQFPDERKEILDKTQNITGGNDKAFRLTWLSLSLFTDNYKVADKRNVIKELIGYSSPRYNMLIRLTAFEMIIQLRLVNRTFINNLFDASFHFNWRLHKPARIHLKKLYQVPDYRQLINTELNKLPEDKQTFLRKYLNN